MPKRAALVDEANLLHAHCMQEIAYWSYCQCKFQDDDPYRSNGSHRQTENSVCLCIDKPAAHGKRPGLTISYYIILLYMNLWYLVVHNQVPGSGSELWYFLSTNRCLLSLLCFPRPFATKEAVSHHPRAYCHRRPYLAHHPAWCQLDPCHLSTKAITLLLQSLSWEMTPKWPEAF